MFPLPTHRFRPRLLDALQGTNRQRLLADVGAGITVGIVALSLAMAFAIASGVKPEQGLITAIVAGALISALGGSNVQVGGPAGAFIVIGFTNGIAVLVGLSQLKDLFGLKIDKMPADFFGQWAVIGGHIRDINPVALGLGLGCLGIVALWPKSYAMATAPVGRVAQFRRWVAFVPGTVVALLLATVLARLMHLPVETIGSRFGGIPQGLPGLALPEFSWQSVKLLLIPTVTLALLGAVESLLCARVADNAAPALPRHDPNQELMAQGLANIVVPLFGGIPATGTVARTMTNVRAGGSSPIAGILLFVAWNMGQWREFARLKHFLLPYRTVLVGTFLLTVIFDLTVAMEVGLMLACGFFILRMGQLFTVRPHPGHALPEGVLAFECLDHCFLARWARSKPWPSRCWPARAPWCWRCTG